MRYPNPSVGLRMLRWRRSFGLALGRK
jgi:hypothetical protein